ncbi:ABC transporter B family member 3-like [Choristoneura fumiferana]|uniref:ABC transporter B family member 3-like n=1 Tax=Choristoneura fumiferana TaxID=7141 RepID=UPI003D15ABA7
MKRSGTYKLGDDTKPKNKQKTDLSNVQFTNGKAATDKDDVSEAEIRDEVPSISFFTLYRFATTKDKVFIFLALICSVLAGTTTPFNTLLFASLLQSMVDYGISVILEMPDDDAFLIAIRDFAIYNCILGVALVVLSYLATVLMNISAFNQVFRIRQEYLKSALNQDFEYFDMHQTGDFAAKCQVSTMEGTK